MESSSIVVSATGDVATVTGYLKSGGRSVCRKLRLLRCREPTRTSPVCV